LRDGGHLCIFIIRRRNGNLADFVRSKDFMVHELCEKPEVTDEGGHEGWLGCDWYTDAHETCEVLKNVETDWLIVDHYAIDAKWEEYSYKFCGKLMVIDDLADRKHHCDLLLDQNLGRVAADYAHLISRDAVQLLGPKYALLREEFLKCRKAQGQNLTRTRLHRILIAMGGTDPHNITCQILKDISESDFLDDVTLTVVLGLSAPHKSAVKDKTKKMKQPIRLLVGISNIADEMQRADLAIGAPGSSSWERCCVGLPTILAAFANNQLSIQKHLVAGGAALEAKKKSGGEFDFKGAIHQFVQKPGLLAQMSAASATICDGEGGNRVLAAMV